MSRHTRKFKNGTTVFNHGDDHALGKWWDIVDSRVEANDGMLVEYSDMFGLEPNLIGIEDNRDYVESQITELIDNYIKQKEDERSNTRTKSNSNR